MSHDDSRACPGNVLRLKPPTELDLRSGPTPDLKGAIVWMDGCKEDGVVGIAVMSFSCTSMAVVAFVDDKVADPARETAVEIALWTIPPFDDDI